MDFFSSFHYCKIVLGSDKNTVIVHPVPTLPAIFSQRSRYYVLHLVVFIAPRTDPLAPLPFPCSIHRFQSASAQQLLLNHQIPGIRTRWIEFSNNFVLAICEAVTYNILNRTADTIEHTYPFPAE